jgi:hypothetical protein
MHEHLTYHAHPLLGLYKCNPPQMKREAGGLGDFFLPAKVEKFSRLLFCAPHPSARTHRTKDLKIGVPLRTAVLHLPSKSYENRRKRSAFVQFSRNRLKGPKVAVYFVLRPTP